MTDSMTLSFIPNPYVGFVLGCIKIRQAYLWVVHEHCLKGITDYFVTEPDNGPVVCLLSVILTLKLLVPPTPPLKNKITL
jgi:hypothetical protein